MAEGAEKSVSKLNCIGHLPLWKGDCNDQTRIVIGESNICPMQICNGRHEAESKTASLCRTAFLQTIETPEYFVAFFYWNSMPGIFDSHLRSSVFLAQFDVNFRLRRTMYDRVLDQIDKELIEKFPVTVDGHAR